MAKRPSRTVSRFYATLIKSGGLKRRLLGRLRSLLVRICDPAVEMRVRNLTLTMPLSHALPIYAHDDPEYDAAIVRLVESVMQFRGHCAVIDIGANIGDTARAILEVPDARVLCIEGNTTFGEFISNNLAGFEGRYIWLAAYAGNQSAVKHAHSVMQAGTARLVENAEAPEVRMVSLSLAVQLANFPAPDLVKIDTDGYDSIILRDELSFLIAHRPVLFFEFDPALFRAIDPDGHSVVDRLAAFGYRHGLAYSNHGSFLGAFRADCPPEFQAHAARIGRGGVDYLDICMFSTQEEFEVAYRRERVHFERVDSVCS